MEHVEIAKHDDNMTCKHFPHYQSGTKPNLVAKILATNFGNLWA